MTSSQHETGFSTLNSPSLAADLADLDQQARLLINAYLPHEPAIPRSRPAVTPLPICIPQTAAGFDVPFVRARPAEAVPQCPSPEEILKFVDGLNLAMSASPPLRVVELTGAVIGFVPNHWAMIAGAVIQTSAQVAIHVLSKTLSDRYLRAANHTLFHPAGLSARLCTTPAMRVLLGKSSPETATPSKLDRFGRAVGSVALHLPIAPILVRAVADKPDRVSPVAAHAADPAQARILRRLAIIDGYAAPLTLDVPPPVPTEGIMDKMSNWAVRTRRSKVVSSENRTDEKRRELLAIEAAGGQRRVSVERTRGGGPIVRLVRAISGTEAPVVQRRLSPRQQKMVERKVQNADILESWRTDRLLWIVIMPQAKDADIQGVEQADDEREYEEVSAGEWANQIKREKELQETKAEMEELNEYETEHANEPRRVGH